MTPKGHFEIKAQSFYVLPISVEIKWFLISQTAVTRKYCENNDETHWDVNCEILLFFDRKNKLSYFLNVNVCRWHFSRIYFCISFSGFSIQSRQIHEFTITRNVYLLAGWLQTSLQSWQYIFSAGGVGIFFLVTSLAWRWEVPWWWGEVIIWRCLCNTITSIFSTSVGIAFL